MMGLSWYKPDAVDGRYTDRSDRKIVHFFNFSAGILVRIKHLLGIN